ncbi:2OG-Fe(II) oxygenase [Phreatobacter sp.]|uniref:2OG-Fe(II) oxygenase n=1 Tax=Phreatobacter sp. TaxID=1966341 RepID=UPI003F6F7125
MSYIDIDRLRAATLQTDPYDFVVIPNFVKADRLKDILADYPDVPGPGSHPPSVLDIRGNFHGLMAELDQEPFRKAVEEKFGVDLAGRPTMYTVRGFTRATDGKIHTDSETKIITVLLYMNDDWDADGGRLRVLRNGTDLNDYAAEIPPNGGTLLIFRRSDRSWHGHEPFAGKRRAIQMNWVTTQAVVDHEQGRHARSSRFKKLIRFITGKAA